MQLQQQLATTTGGAAYELTNVAQLADDLQLERQTELDTRIHALWCTPLWFGLAVFLMLLVTACSDDAPVRKAMVATANTHATDAAADIHHKAGAGRLWPLR